MGYEVDVKSEYKLARSVVLRNSLIFSFLLTTTLIIDALLVIFSKEDYLLNLIIAIIVTVLFSWYAVFFFSVIYKDMNGKYRYYKNIESGIQKVDEVEFIGKSNELTYVNGLYVYPLKVKYIDGINTEEKTIYVESKELDFNKGDKLTISTYQRILLKADKHS